MPIICGTMKGPAVEGEGNVASNGMSGVFLMSGTALKPAMTPADEEDAAEVGSSCLGPPKLLKSGNVGGL